AGDSLPPPPRDHARTAGEPEQPEEPGDNLAEREGEERGEAQRSAAIRVLGAERVARFDGLVEDIDAYREIAAADDPFRRPQGPDLTHLKPSDRQKIVEADAIFTRDPTGKKLG